MDVSILTATPVVLGVLTCTEEEQAVKRSTGDGNHGLGWGKTAVEMGLLRMSATGMGKKARITWKGQCCRKRNKMLFGVGFRVWRSADSCVFFFGEGDA